MKFSLHQIIRNVYIHNDMFLLRKLIFQFASIDIYLPNINNIEQSIIEMDSLITTKLSKTSDDTLLVVPMWIDINNKLNKTIDDNFENILHLYFPLSSTLKDTKVTYSNDQNRIYFEEYTKITSRWLKFMLHLPLNTEGLYRTKSNNWVISRASNPPIHILKYKFGESDEQESLLTNQQFNFETIITDSDIILKFGKDTSTSIQLSPQRSVLFLWLLEITKRKINTITDGDANRIFIEINNFFINDKDNHPFGNIDKDKDGKNAKGSNHVQSQVQDIATRINALNRQVLSIIEHLPNIELKANLKRSYYLSSTKTRILYQSNLQNNRFKVLRELISDLD